MLRTLVEVSHGLLQLLLEREVVLLRKVWPAAILREEGELCSFGFLDIFDDTSIAILNDCGGHGGPQEVFDRDDAVCKATSTLFNPCEQASIIGVPLHVVADAALVDEVERGSWVEAL